ncbi:protein trichome berefringence-like 7 isoform X3 [Durio zibethinus]|uniref:Protein trichome berefringence-like 7 isoform X3 n=1 Tax=Durio zibethinus TaxID=66656 RepID=A0A6P5YKX3_DURZI|nr:protein trichome berefringence-like 7 isoform X3 [Durio zibethinus]
MVNNFSRSTSFNRRALNVESPRFLSIPSPRALHVLSPKPLGFASPRVHHRLAWVSHLFPVLLLIGALISFIIVLGGGYMYVIPSLSQAFLGYDVLKFNDSSNVCDFFYGSWVIDDGYPLYNASECPFAEQGFNCLGNGREDKDYLKWRWKPKNCDIPRFNVHNVLEMLRDKRIVFVGDSMSRTQWESLICLLMTGVEDKKSVYEVNGNKITKRIRFLGVRFSSFNFTVEFFRSVFLVQHGWMPRHAPKRVRSTLKLDKLDDISNEWINADVLIFNTGQWWVPGKLFETEKSRRFCNVTQNPLSETEGRDQSIFSETIFEVIKNMTVPITVLHVTSMSAFRRDAHVGRWSDNPSIPDCSHWCLPGVPDVWNEIFLSYLLADYELPVVNGE